MEIKSFDDLKDTALAEPFPQRLLIVLLEAEAGEAVEQEAENEVIRGSGMLIPVMATDIELTRETRLDVVAEEADSLGHPWDLLLVSCLAGSDGRLASSEEAAPWLEDMVNAVATGKDLSGYAVFDRAGCPVRLQTGHGGAMDEGTPEPEPERRLQ